MMEENYVCAQDNWPSLPDGIYQAQCFSIGKGYFLGGKAHKLFLHFNIIDEGAISKVVRYGKDTAEIREKLTDFLDVNQD